MYGSTFISSDVAMYVTSSDSGLAKPIISPLPMCRVFAKSRFVTAINGKG